MAIERTFSAAHATAAVSALRPPVVLVHGVASSSDHGWRSAGWIDRLTAAGREVIPVDLPGHGEALRSHDPGAYADAADQVAAAFADRGPVAAVGFSVGARLLTEVAARGLAEFERLALLGVGLPLLEVNTTAIHALAAGLLAEEPPNAEVRVFRRVIDQAGNDPAAVSAFMRRRIRCLTRADLDAIHCPVLVVTGDRDAAAPGEALAELLPNATAFTPEGANHFTVQADPRTLDVVLDFLAG